MPEVSRRTIAVSLIFLGYQFGNFPADEKKKAKFLRFCTFRTRLKTVITDAASFQQARPGQDKKRVVMTGEAVLLL